MLNKVQDGINDFLSELAPRLAKFLGAWSGAAEAVRGTLVEQAGPDLLRITRAVESTLAEIEGLIPAVGRTVASVSEIASGIASGQTIDAELRAGPEGWHISARLRKGDGK
jgi:hypothetical protein